MLFLRGDARSHSFSTFLPFSDSDYFLAPSFPPIPSFPPDSINIQPKYESTKINLSCLGIRSALSLCRRNGGLHLPATSLKPRLVLSFPFVSFPSLEGHGRVSAVRAAELCMCGDVCAGILHVVCALICGDHLLFPGLRITEARVYLCLQLLALVASRLQERLMNK